MNKISIESFNFKQKIKKSTMNGIGFYTDYTKDETTPQGFKFENMNLEGVKLIITTKSVEFNQCTLKNTIIEFSKETWLNKLKRIFNEQKAEYHEFVHKRSWD